MKLYYDIGACSMATHIVLRELGLPYEAVHVNLKTHTLDDGRDFYAINPKGYVPAIEMDDGKLLTEGAAILQYVADLKPEAGLLPPAGTLERYRAIEWLTFISSELHKGFSPLFNAALPAEAKQVFVERLEKRFAYLDAQLAGKTWLMGDRFTVADAYAYTVLNWSKGLKLDLDRWANLSAYVKRVGGRPKVRETEHTEKLAA